MSFQLRPAERKQVKMRLGLSGASGFGKTYSALLLAYGLTGDWTKIALIDTENGSGELYSDLGAYNVIPFHAPYSPERYIEALRACEKAGMEAIIIDSISHEWEGKGGCLEIVESLGGRYQDWGKVTPRHHAFVTAILSSPCHIITTVRRKQDYDMVKEGNKTSVVKVGMKEVTREGWEYELTVSLEIINDKHMARASKDRTGLFVDKPEFIVTSETGKTILEWCNSGKAVEPEPVPDKLTPEQFKKIDDLLLSGLCPKETREKIERQMKNYTQEQAAKVITNLEEIVNQEFNKAVEKQVKPLKKDMQEASGN